jgi:hypothetical protein
MTVIDELGLVCKYSRLYIKVSATGASDNGAKISGL